MYLHEYHDPGLHGIGKKLKKLIKPVAHIAAAVATGGASLAVTAAMLNAKKQKEAQQRAADAAAAQEQAFIKQITAPQQPSIAPAVVTPSAGGTMPVSIAPVATAPPPVQPMYAAPQQQWTSPPPPSPMYMTQPGESGGAPMSIDSGSKQPAWLIPAAVGAAVLLAMNMRGGSRQ